MYLYLIYAEEKQIINKSRLFNKIGGHFSSL